MSRVLRPSDDIKKPKVFLMDEPLSNLDAKLRAHMRFELIELHKRLGTTFVYVTHDQVEAMSMGEDIVIMDQGRLQQVDTPMKIYNEPENLFTARFIGSPPMNVIHFNKVEDFFEEDESRSIAYMGFRPEKAVLSNKNEAEGIYIKGRISSSQTLGAENVYKIETDAGEIQVRQFLSHIESASTVEVFVALEDLYFFNEQGERINRKPCLYEDRKLIVNGR